MSENQLDLLQAYFTRAFPGRMDPQVSSLVPLSSGWESDVYSFTAEWGQPDQRQHEELILRIYPGEDAPKKSASEFHNLSLLYQAGYPVPRVDLLERENSTFGHPFLIMQCIPGSSMWKPLFHSTPEEGQKMLELFCSLFSRLHAIDWQSIMPDAAGFEAENPYAIVERQLTRWQPYVNAMPLPGFQPGWQWLVDHCRDVTSTRVSLVHWDFHPANILLTEDLEAYVIDWTGLELTDYRFDLSWTLLLIDSYEGSEWRDRVLREYERQSGRPSEGLEYFEAVASFRRLFSVVGSLVLGAEKLGMRPGAEEVMRRQAAQLRRVYTQFQTITRLTIPEVETFLLESDA